jgi:hypothetical protein
MSVPADTMVKEHAQVEEGKSATIPVKVVNFRSNNEGGVMIHQSSGSSSGRSVPSKPIAIAASVGANVMLRTQDLNLDDPDADNGDDEKYRKLKMKYLTSLKVVRPSGQASERMMLSQSVPDSRFAALSLRSAPIAIPERTRRVDDFFYKSPTDDAMDQQDEQCQFILEL